MLFRSKNLPIEVGNPPLGDEGKGSNKDPHNRKASQDSNSDGKTAKINELDMINLEGSNYEIKPNLSNKGSMPISMRTSKNNFFVSENKKHRTNLDDIEEMIRKKKGNVIELKQKAKEMSEMKRSNEAKAKRAIKISIYDIIIDSFNLSKWCLSRKKIDLMRKSWEIIEKNTDITNIIKKQFEIVFLKRILLTKTQINLFKYNFLDINLDDYETAMTYLEEINDEFDDVNREQFMELLKKDDMMKQNEYLQLKLKEFNEIKDNDSKVDNLDVDTPNDKISEEKKQN